MIRQKYVPTSNNIDVKKVVRKFYSLNQLYNNFTLNPYSFLRFDSYQRKFFSVSILNSASLKNNKATTIKNLYSKDKSSIRKLSTDDRNLDKIRNIGIIAHIDAGKTTTTERLLYYAGVIRHLGNVDRGDTMMDFLPAERERGITIKSACINLQWKSHNIALIDTPGHVDFTQEVESSLRILDSAVLLIDAVKGVQAQTSTVYNQAKRYNLPCIALINKMDREGADFFSAIHSINQRLGKESIPIQLPLFKSKIDQPTIDSIDGGEFVGIIDLISEEEYIWSNSIETDGKEYVKRLVSKDSKNYIGMKSARNLLIERLADFDDEFAIEFLEKDESISIDKETLITVIRRSLLNNSFIPVLAGASLRNIAIQPLLDAIILYLPSPREINQGKIQVYPLQKPLRDEKLVSNYFRSVSASASLLAYSFKVSHDTNRGNVSIVYVRVYTGTLKSRDLLVNTYAKLRQSKLSLEAERERFHPNSTQFSHELSESLLTINDQNLVVKEKVLKLLKLNGEDSEEVNELKSGEIGAIIGLKSTFAGDTLMREGESPYIYMKPMVASEPVFFASLTSNSSKDDKGMFLALEALQKEDPSIHITRDEETGQTILAGMGYQ